jgi:hypothetical protein
MDTYEDCAYYGSGAVTGFTQAVDVSNPSLPLPTSVLTSQAMTNPWESLQVNAKRGLLVADSTTSPNLDIYDISGDCRNPELISSTNMAPALGHEGWFAPDGETYYMSTTGADGAATVFPVDISDPTDPKRLASWAFGAQTHGGSTTEDGKRSYICQQKEPPNDKVLIVDTSEVASREPMPEPRLLAEIPLRDNQWCQEAIRVTYNGHPFLIQFGERSGAADCSRAADNWANFGYPRIYDFADESKPKLVSSALLEVHLPEHCSEVTGEGAINGLGYSVHKCAPDRLYDPTILACTWLGAGMRVLDIRDPYNPVEIGYYNPVTPGPTPSIVVGAAPTPIVRSDEGQIWFVRENGFFVLRFRDDAWPFEGSAPCPEFDDYTFAQYNPGSSCETASFDGIGNPAPGKPLRCRGRRASLVATSRLGSIVRGTPGKDVLVGGPGPDRIVGRDGKDLICGGGGDDHIGGRAQNDRIYGQGGDDLIRGNTGVDRCVGGPGGADRAVACEREAGVP